MLPNLLIAHAFMPAVRRQRHISPIANVIVETHIESRAVRVRLLLECLKWSPTSPLVLLALLNDGLWLVLLLLLLLLLLLSVLIVELILFDCDLHGGGVVLLLVFLLLLDVFAVVVCKPGADHEVRLHI